MVVPFAPRSNTSNLCDGVIAYEASRPPTPLPLKQAGLALFVILTFVQIGTIVWLWKWRDKPRFRKVRPFSISVLLILGYVVYQIPAYLAVGVDIPCALLVACYNIALSWFGAITAMRTLVLILEAYYARLTKKDTGLFQDDASSQTVSVAPGDGWDDSFTGSILKFMKNIQFLAKVVVGWVKIEDLSVSELVITKNSYSTMFALICVPSILATILLIVLVPPFQTCYNCEAFLEVPIAFSSCLLLYTLFTGKLGLEAYRLVGWDDKGVVLEFLVVITVIVPIAGTIWLMMIFDPGEIQFKREFHWSLLTIMATVIWWVVAFGYQFYAQIRQDRKRSKLEIVDMQATFLTEPGTKKDFVEFAAKHYISESLQFLEDVTTFKQLFFEKAENWRVSKFKSLVEMYVLSGSKMEVNISHSMRQAIIRKYENISSNVRDGYEAFDDAVKEVERMIHDGAWTEFLMKRSRYRSAVVPSSNA